MNTPLYQNLPGPNCMTLSNLWDLLNQPCVACRLILPYPQCTLSIIFQHGNHLDFSHLVNNSDFFSGLCILTKQVKLSTCVVIPTVGTPSLCQLPPSYLWRPGTFLDKLWKHPLGPVLVSPKHVCRRVTASAAKLPKQ